LCEQPQEIEKLNQRKQGKKRLNESELMRAAEAIIKKHGCSEFLKAGFEVKQRIKQVRKYKSRTGQEQRVETELIVRVERLEQAIERKKTLCGWRVYASNKKEIEVEEAVFLYREQYQIERSISRLKGRSLGLQPVYLQKESRIVGLINLLSLCLRELTLLEYYVGRELAARGENLKGIYSSQRGRQTASPSAELILERV